MNATFPANTCAESAVAVFPGLIESLTKQVLGTMINLTTPPTPLNDAHQGGYFFGDAAIPSKARRSGHE
jgi:hypothetical protein